MCTTVLAHCLGVRVGKSLSRRGRRAPYCRTSRCRSLRYLYRPGNVARSCAHNAPSNWVSHPNRIWKDVDMSHPARTPKATAATTLAAAAGLAALWLARPALAPAYTQHPAVDCPQPYSQTSAALSVSSVGACATP